MALAKVMPSKDVTIILPRGVTHFSFLGEVSDILYGGSMRMGHHMGTPTTKEVVIVSM